MFFHKQEIVPSNCGSEAQQHLRPGQWSLPIGDIWGYHIFQIHMKGLIFYLTLCSASLGEQQLVTQSRRLTFRSLMDHASEPSFGLLRR